MDTQITTIKHELDRRFSLSAKIVKKLFSEDEIHVIFPAVFDYLSFVETTPLLQDIISEDRARQEDLHTELLFDHAQKPNADVFMDMNYDNFNDFHLCNKYDYLKELIYDPIYRLNHEIDPFKMDSWALALIKSPYRVFRQTNI